MWVWIIYDRVNFPVTLLIAEFIVCAKLRRRRRFPLRVSMGAVVLAGISYLWELVFGGLGLAWVSAIKFLVLFLFSIGLLALCYKASLRSLLFCSTAGYCIQHAAYQLHSIIITLAGIDAKWGQAATLALCCAACYAAIYFFFARKLKYAEDNICISNLGMLWLSVIIILVAVFISFYGAVYSIGHRSEVLLIVVCLFSVASCVLALISLLALNAKKQGEDERAVLSHMLHQAKMQYDATAENINLINIKCHDLKHKILSLKDRVDTDELKRISNAVDIYDSSFDTGNRALDVVLTEKTLLCKSKGIRLTCMMNGSVLNGWSAGDIYSFFGNAIDNAINSVSGLDEDKRSISITEQTRGKLKNIRIENFYSGEMKFEDGLPVTSGDRRYHGFGMKSIKMVADSYGCILSVKADDGIFCLDLFVA